jgi:hypothetical protein
VQPTAVKGKMLPAETGPDIFGGGSTSSSSFEFLTSGRDFTDAGSVEKSGRGALEASRKHRSVEYLRREYDDRPVSRGLERGLNRPVINETGLEGIYDLEVHGDAGNRDEFIRMLRDQPG